jgi:hypothetical protein
LQDPPKFTKIGIFGLTTNHLAALLSIFVFSKLAEEYRTQICFSIEIPYPKKTRNDLFELRSDLMKGCGFEFRQEVRMYRVARF